MVPNLQRPTNPATRAGVDDSCSLYRNLFTETVKGKKRKFGGECKLIFSMLTAADTGILDDIIMEQMKENAARRPIIYRG
eukprot:1187616-Prorocentrum_minimum.AAC.10